ncbi:MAG: VWA domain-containing protein [Chloroflexi bacterium]|nr:VWA domain-containing protein [Chloroflexota bacterium]MCY3697206.1 VWA domain-containing protein [Chloroflexota bacterium]
MPTRFRYSQWDGTQDVPALDADEVLQSLSDDLLSFGDLQQALRNMMQRGIRTPDGDRTDGLRDLLQQLRQQRRQQLERFDLSSVFDDIQQQLDEILDMERDTLDDRLDEVGPRPEAPPQSLRDSSPPEGGSGDQTPPSSSSLSPSGEMPPSSSPLPPSGGEMPQAEGGSPESGLTDDEMERLKEALRQRLERKQEQIESLPEDAAGQMKDLQEYEFEDDEARQKYEELLEQLKQAMMNRFFNDMNQMMSDMSPEDMDQMREMMQDLNEMLERQRRGEDPRFDEFMDKWGDMFGDDPPQSLDELVEQMQRQAAQMQNLMSSLPGEMRQQLNDMMQQLMGEMGMEQELSQLAQNLEALYPMRDLLNQYPFRGQEEIDLQAAMSLMGDMQQLDELERALERVQYGGNIDDIDPDQLEELMGEEAREILEQLKQLLELLEEAGYLEKKGNAWELTPRGNRRIGEKALAEIYANLKRQNFGKHNVPETGRYGDRADDSKLYEFGDPFHLNLKETISNAILRTAPEGGPQLPVNLTPDDFEVYRSETLTQTATVVMLDLSWSMALRGSFQAAKKVAMALNNLIRMQYPRDSLYLVGFSAYARELKADQLPYVRWDETVLGTNMHHALLIAQQLLAKHKLGTRQVIMITDGEPTAHLEQGRSYFAYPPSPITIRETLKEVRHCTKKDIVINVFMLDRSYYLKEFVDRVARINGGRVFYSQPDELGEYVLHDFVTHRRKTLSRS